jgi:hypothetical protein
MGGLEQVKAQHTTTPAREYITVNDPETHERQIQASRAKTGNVDCGHFVLKLKKNPNLREVALWKSSVASSF